MRVTPGAMRSGPILAHHLTRQRGGSISGGDDVHPYVQAVLDLEPVAYWRLNETSGSTAEDSSDNNNHGTIFGATLGVSGVLETAYSFDGVDDYVGDTNPGPTGATAISSALWFKTTAGDDNYCVLSWGEDAEGNAYRINVEDGVIWIRVDGGATSWGSGYNDGEWHFLVLTQPSSATLADVRAYVDNTDLGLGTGTQNVAPTDNFPMRIGAGFAAVGDVAWFFPGDIDEVAVYEKTLSASDVEDLWQKSGMAA